MWLLHPFCATVIRSADKEKLHLLSQIERTLLNNKYNLGLLTPFERSQEISPNALTLPMRVTLASFHVAGQLSVILKLRSPRVFPVIYGTYVFTMNVSEPLVPRELFS